MSVSRFLAAMLVAGLLQFSFFHRFRVAGAGPDCLLIVCVYVGLNAGASWALVGPFSCGLLKDVLGAGRFGLHGLLFLCVGYVLNRHCRHLAHGGAGVRTVLVGASALVCSGAAICWELASRRGGGAAPLLVQLPVGAVYTMLLSLPAAVILKKAKVCKAKYDF